MSDPIERALERLAEYPYGGREWKRSVLTDLAAEIRAEEGRKLSYWRDTAFARVRLGLLRRSNGCSL